MRMSKGCMALCACAYVILYGVHRLSRVTVEESGPGTTETKGEKFRSNRRRLVPPVYSLVESLVDDRRWLAH